MGKAMWIFYSYCWLMICLCTLLLGSIIPLESILAAENPLWNSTIEQSSLYVINTAKSSLNDSPSTSDLFGVHPSIIPMMDKVNCLYINRKDFVSAKSEFTIESLCTLLEIVRHFTDSTVVAILSTREVHEEIDSVCQTDSFSNASDEFHFWTLPETFPSQYISRELDSHRNKDIKKFVIFCSAVCTSLVMSYFYSISNVLKQQNPVYFIGHTEILYAGIDLPKLIITIGQSYDGTAQYCDSKDDTKIHSHTNTSNESGLSTKMKGKNTIFAKHNQVWIPIATVAQESTNSNKTRFPTQLFNMPPSYPFRKNGGRIVYRVATTIEAPYTIIHMNSKELYNDEEVSCGIGKVCWKYETIVVGGGTGAVGEKVKRPYCCVGFLMDMLDQLEVDLGFTSYLYMVKDGKYGEIVNDTWVGLVGDLVHKRADIVMASLNINSRRSVVIDYSHPFLVGGMSLITLHIQKPIPFLNLLPLKSLTSELWMYTVLVTFGASISLMLMEKLQGKKYDFIESLTYTAGLLFQRDIGGKNPQVWSSQMTAIATAVFTLIIISTYAAVLTSNLVTYDLLLPVTGFKDEKIRNPTTAFKYGTLAHSSYTQMFRESPDPVWNRMNTFMKAYNFIETDVAFEKLRTGELDAIIQDYYIAHHHVAKDPGCNFQFAGSPIKDGGSGIAVQKGSYLKQLISEQILTYQGRDFLQDLRSRWMINECISSESSSSSNNNGVASEIGINYFGGMFLVLLGAMVVGFLLLIIEWVIARIQYSNSLDLKHTSMR